MGREFLDGNEAIARAAIMARCNFFAGYPITPSSSILQSMLAWLPRVGGIGVQAEDEIASIGFCIAAAMAGRKVLTATSGPGISLYSENIGLAIMGETPMVIVDVQRQGPATGSATKGAEGDIQFIHWVTSGGMPVIALSPASVLDAYELTFKAFNFAEKYRTPVFVLSSKEVAVTRESVDLSSVKLPPIIERKRVGTGESYSPHFFDKPSDVPLISDFGGKHIARFTTSTHDMNANMTSSPAVIQNMIDHYKAKIESVADELAIWVEDFQENAETLIVSYGITSRSVKVAVEEVRKRGAKISSLYLKTLFPVPNKVIQRAIKNIKKIVIPEMNMGQYFIEIERLTRREVEIIGVNKMDTTLISPKMIIEKGKLL
jgi:2-oxoglutarate/2-oxoacid ferredoxin oxidoreductase subunit alpha